MSNLNLISNSKGSMLMGKALVLLLCFGSNIIHIVSGLGESDEILGCGGFVRSQFPIDFNKIEIKLFTKQGSLKMKTECAPTTGYYFIPLEGTGEYVLKINPPKGWTFNPSEYQVKVDGINDKCSKGQDINFDFKGFSISGNVVTKGFTNQGPSNVVLVLSGPNNLVEKTKSKANGQFTFDSLPPGKYSIKSSHPNLKFEKDTYQITIENDNVQIDNQFVVNGYEISGTVSSDKNPVSGVSVVLLAEQKIDQVSGCKSGKPEGFVVQPGHLSHVLCYQVTDNTGEFHFNNLKPGKYSIVPMYKGKNIVYNVSPDHLDVTLNHESLSFPNAFEVEGFTVLGNVRGIKNARVLVNGVEKAISTDDGSFSIQKMKAGTYEFQILSDNFKFEPQQIKVNPSNPILPAFEPSKFQICGQVKLKDGPPSSNAEIVVSFQKVSTDTGSTVYRELVPTDSSKVCVFLEPGKYSTTVESQTEKYFTPTSQTIQVPNMDKDFIFVEFTGSISGNVNCKLAKTSECFVKINLLNKQGKVLQDTKTDSKGSYKFPNLKSGEYNIQVDEPSYCWQAAVIPTHLKNVNVENINFVQNGYQITLWSSHSTKLEILSGTKVLHEVNLKSQQENDVCITKANGAEKGYTIKPVGCHQFEQNSYTFQPKKGDKAKLKLIALTHEFSGTVISNSKISELEIKKNGMTLPPDALKFAKEEKAKFIYDLKFQEKSDVSVQLEFFSYKFIFSRQAITFLTGSDCQNNIFSITAQKSHVIKGKLLPALDGVEIKIDLIGDPDSTQYVYSNEKGEFIAGPFIHNHGFQVTPKMPGYTFRSIDSEPYFFQVLQLAKIQVVVEQPSPTGENNPVPQVLLSLSGPNAYRQNKITDTNGEFVFNDLNPGQYYLKALLKEFSFEPGAMHIDLAEQETKQIKLSARRESFSIYGQIASLSGDFMPNLIVSAKGQGNCSEYSEENISDEFGQFRIWSLKSFCNYKLAIEKKDDFFKRVERTIPETMDIKIENEDIKELNFVIITPVKRMDVTLRCETNNPKYLESLKAVVSNVESGNPTFTVPFNGISYIILPPIPKDSSSYIINFESSLNPTQYEYTLPDPINFVSDEAYAHYRLKFNVNPIHRSEEIGKSSYFAFGFIILGFIIIINFERISSYLKEAIDIYLHKSGSSAAAKKSKLKTK